MLPNLGQMRHKMSQPQYLSILYITEMFTDGRAIELKKERLCHGVDTL